MAVRREGLFPLSVVAGWYHELGACAMTRSEEMGHERLLLWPSGHVSEQDGRRCYWRELAG